MKKITLFTLGIMLLFSNACKRKTVETYYFNCKIDGQYFEPEKQGGLGEYPFTAKLLYDGIDLRIDVSKGIQNIFLWVKDSNKIISSSYQLFNTPSYYARATYDNNTSTDEFSTDSINSGFMQIQTIDKTNMTVSGTFSFAAYNPVLVDTVHITDGNFKLKYTIH